MTIFLDQAQPPTTAQQEQVHKLYSGLPSTLLISLAVSILLVALQWPLIDHALLLMWLSLFILVLSIRAVLLVFLRRSPKEKIKWDGLTQFRLGVAASSLMWGMGGYWMFPYHDPLGQIWLTLIFLGVSVTGAMNYSVDRVSSILVASLSFLPILVLLALTPRLPIYLPLIGMIYLIYIVVNSQRIQNMQLDNIRFRIDAETYTEKLRVDEERWNLALEGTGAGVFDWNIDQNRVLFSQSWKQLLGLDDSDITNELSHWENRIHPDDQARVKSDLQAHLNDSSVKFQCEHRLLCQTGEYRWFLANGQLVNRDSQGKPLRFIGILTDISKLKLAEKMQESLRTISEASQSSENLMTLFLRIHEVIDELLPAKNFFVALYDDTLDELSFPYFVDEFDAPPSKRKLDNHTLSAQVIRARQAVLLKSATRQNDPLDANALVGSASLDWLGVPLLLKERVIGVLVVQSYSGDVRYTERDKQLLQFVSGQTAIAVERKQNQERLVHEKRVQTALHQISEAAHISENLQDLFAQIHHIVGELIPAKNFFVALYDSDIDELSFPYFVDENDERPAPRKLDEGTLSAIVIKTGDALLLTRDEPNNIVEPGTAMVGTAFLDWLGVPLIVQRRTIGILAVQSYGGVIRYAEKDKELLKFVSAQVATAIDRKQNAEQIKHLAQHDVLTDLPNRALFNDRLQVAIARNLRYKDPLALMYLDLDKFKPVNDTYGHAIGDLLLKQAAQRINQCVRDSDTVGRVGGDEFVILLHSIKTKETASIVAEKIRSALARPFTVGEHTLSISGSIGVAIYPEHGCDQKTLSISADTAMYQAKNGGGNRYVIEG